MSPSDDHGVDLVVKIGGARGISFEGLAEDIAAMLREGRRIVVVHGGSSEATDLGSRLGMTPEFITSPSGNVSRRSDRRTIEVLMMACAGKINKTLVEALQARGVNALGITGLDGRLLAGSRKKAVRSVHDGKVVVIRDDFGGKVEEVNAGLLRLLLDAGYVPAIGPLALGREGEALNVDADRVAAAVASAAQAKTLIILSNVPGLLKDPRDPSTLIRRIPRGSIGEYGQYAAGRMKKKVLAAREALSGGVERVVISDACSREPLKGALAGEGTVIE